MTVNIEVQWSYKLEVGTSKWYPNILGIGHIECGINSDGHYYTVIPPSKGRQTAWKLEDAKAKLIELAGLAT